MEYSEKWEAEFVKRFKKHYDELKWLYCEVYNNDMKAFSGCAIPFMIITRAEAVL